MTATFGLTEIRIGLWPFLIYRAVVDAVGDRRALELSITGRILAAREAAEMGLAHHVTPPAALMDRAGEIATAVGQLEPRRHEEWTAIRRREPRSRLGTGRAGGSPLS